MSPTAPRFPGSSNGFRGHYDREYAAMILIPQAGQGNNSSHITGPKLVASSRPDIAPAHGTTLTCFEKSCNKKVRNSVGMYCEKHACHVMMTAGPFCPSISMPGSRFCTLHTTCHYETCKYPRVNGEINQALPFCEHHSCTQRGCSNLRAPGVSVCHDHALVCATENCPKKTARGFYCSEHICLIMGCQNQRTHGDWCYSHSRCENEYCVKDRTRTSIYCTGHAFRYCQSVDCKAHVSPNENFCMAHECSRDECHAPRIFVENNPSQFCLTHTCFADGCRLTTDWSGSHFCRKHRCAEVACPVAVRDESSGFCIAHNCTSAMCAAPRAPGMEFCNTHSLIPEGNGRPLGRCLSRERIIKYRQEQERREKMVQATQQEQLRLQEIAKHSRENARELHLDSVIYPPQPTRSPRQQTQSVETDYRQERYVPTTSYSPTHNQSKAKGKAVEQPVYLPKTTYRPPKETKKPTNKATEQKCQPAKVPTQTRVISEGGSRSSKFLLPSKAYVPEPAKSPGCSGASSASRSPASAASKASPASTTRTSPCSGSSSKSSPQPAQGGSKRAEVAPLKIRKGAMAGGPAIHSPIPVRQMPPTVLKETFYIDEDSDNEDDAYGPAMHGSGSDSSDSFGTSHYSGSEHEAVAISLAPSVGGRAGGKSDTLPSKIDCSSFIARMVNLAGGSQVSTATSIESATTATKKSRATVPRRR